MFEDPNKNYFQEQVEKQRRIDFALNTHNLLEREKNLAQQERKNQALVARTLTISIILILVSVISYYCKDDIKAIRNSVKATQQIGVARQLVLGIEINTTQEGDGLVIAPNPIGIKELERKFNEQIWEYEGNVDLSDYLYQSNQDGTIAVLFINFEEKTILKKPKLPEGFVYPLGYDYALIIHREQKYHSLV